MKDNTIYRKRQFISADPHSDAFVSARVTRYGGDEIGGGVKISDCDRRINLEVNGFDRKHTNQTLRKFRTLIKVLEEVCEAIEDGREGGK